MLGLGTPELIIILVVVLLLFGPGRIGRISGELGKSIKAFRDGMSGDEKNDSPKDSNNNIEPK